MQPPPTFSPIPDGTFEATTATPYLGTILDGKYAPNATDSLLGDVSASVRTYLTETNQLIALSGPGAFVFPLGKTGIRHELRDNYSSWVFQDGAITVADRTPPALAMAGPAEVVLAAGPGAVDYAGKVRAGAALRGRRGWLP
jgi:hypothetical protein